MSISGHQDSSMLAVLNKYIPVAAAFGGMIIGLISIFSDLVWDNVPSETKTNMIFAYDNLSNNSLPDNDAFHCLLNHSWFSDILESLLY